MGHIISTDMIKSAIMEYAMPDCTRFYECCWGRVRKPGG